MKIKDVSGLLDKIGEIEIALPEKMHLEPTNFRISSEGWEEKIQEGIVYKINPEGDITEFVSGVPDSIIGEQLFTWNAAMRETKKAGKRIPTNEELNELEEELKDCKVFLGYRDADDGNYYLYGNYAFLWSSTGSDTNAWYRRLDGVDTTVRCSGGSKMDGLSVHCLREIDNREDKC